MVPFLIYIFFKKYRKQNQAATGVSIRKFLSTRVYIIFVSLIILLLLIPFLSSAQNSLLHYKIVQGGDDIGWLRLEKNITGSRTNLSLVSELRTRVIFLIEVSAKETSVFENGQLLHSSQYRKTNGTVKVNKQTSRVVDKYVVNDNGEKQYLSIPVVVTNLLSLYFQEPTSFSTVYCDKYETFSKITKTDDGGYKVEFPDGNSNTFYYTWGICTKVKISHTFYTAQIIKTS
jgi:hypothetical protein